MRKLIVAAMLSLDGVMQAPGAADEDTSDGFAHGGWVWPHGGPSDTVMGGVFEHPYELVLGRRTYDIFAAYWPTVSGGDYDAIATGFNATVKHVATHRPDSLPWHNSRALGADVVADLRARKREPGPDLVTQGSSALVQQLLATDIVDELRLLVFPVLLGRGKRLFDDRALATEFRVESASVSPRGVITTRYLRAGDVRTGAPHA